MSDAVEKANDKEVLPAQQKSRNPKNTLAVVFVLCALAVPIATAIFNPPVESWTEKVNGVDVVHGSWLITSSEFVPTSGDFGWRYFQWGVLAGARTPDFRYALRPMLGYELGNETARVINITNPTPFHITLGLLVVAWLFRRSALKEVKEEEADSKDHSTLGLNG